MLLSLLYLSHQDLPGWLFCVYKGLAKVCFPPRFRISRSPLFCHIPIHHHLHLAPAASRSPAQLLPKGSVFADCQHKHHLQPPLLFCLLSISLVYVGRNSAPAGKQGCCISQFQLPVPGLAPGRTTTQMLSTS